MVYNDATKKNGVETARPPIPKPQEKDIWSSGENIKTAKPSNTAITVNNNEI